LILKEQELAKQYISIIRLFEHLAIDYNNEIVLSRVKKQLSIEFDFASTGFIELEGYTYNKADVFEELDNPHFTIRLPYHVRIWKNKLILMILEDNHVNLLEINKAIEEFISDEVFDYHFCGYFAAPFNNISRNFINHLQLDNLGEWLRYEDFILIQDREEAFRSIRQYLDETIRNLKNISTDNYHLFRDKIKEWVTPGWYRFMNNLPDDFYEQKNEVVHYLINLTVKIQHKSREESKQISSDLVELTNIRSNLMETIHSNDAIYNGSSTISERKLTFKGWIWVVIVIIRVLLIGMHGCN